MRKRSLKARLDRLYEQYDFDERRSHDPIDLVHRYSRPEDIETAGLFVSALAYGRVALFMQVARRLLDYMGDSPNDFVRSFSRKRRKFPDISYRFARQEDLHALVYAMSVVIDRYGALEQLFTSALASSDQTVYGGIVHGVREIRAVDLSPVYGENVVSPGFLHLVSSPETGGAAKRMALYFRWMVRTRDIDFGIWKRVGAHRLVIPLDTHIARISRCLGFTRRLGSGWKTAVDITDSLKTMDPEDPLKYDFVLCHQGISGQCRGIRSVETCARCELR